MASSSDPRVPSLRPRQGSGGQGEPPGLDGALILDKPKGVTSHDAVAAARRLLREKRIGHAGTLDPLATGVLVLLCGRATRLSRFIMASDKTYEARILFGVTTDTYDVTGTVTSRSSSVPAPADIERALDSLRGSYLQEPPAFSAKKVQGQRAYDMARKGAAVALQAVPVTVARIDVAAFEAPRLAVVLTCSAGFYVRSFAHALGQLTGSGACLEELRRTRSGDFGLEQAVRLDDAPDRDSLAARVIPLGNLLRSLPARVVTAEGRQRVAHGRELTAAQLAGSTGVGASDVAPHGVAWVRLLDADGDLIALGRATGATLHPSVVLI